MLINSKYSYLPLERVETEQGRRYSIGQNITVPSVTTILSKTKDMTYINEWIESVGEDRANKIKNEASFLGTELHKNIENYILGKDFAGSFMSRALAKTIIKKGLASIDEVWGIESNLHYQNLYAGTTDLVGVYQSKPAIIDFKNSINTKSRDQIEDYFLQLVAYAMAHNEMFGTTIDCGVIMLATRDSKYQEFIIEDDEFKIYTDKWIDKLSQYYNKYT